MSKRTVARALSATLLGIGGAALLCQRAVADEGGVSFWLPGQYGSLTAVPQQPGLSLAIVNYNAWLSAGGNVAASREVSIGRFNPNVNVNLNVDLHATANMGIVSPSYVFATPVLGGQLAIGMAGIVGRSSADINGALTTQAGPFSTTRQGEISDARYGVGDLYPQASLRWNSGVNNWETYLTGDIPVGSYDSGRLANLGIGHAAIDGGGAYTYFNPATGHEFSVLTGLTYNFTNPSTNYQNGVDWHVDWGASQFLSKSVMVGAVGYFFQQITADQGAAPFLGANLSRVAAIGPQVGFFIPSGPVQTYLNFKAYFEFAAENRPSGWNAWVTLSFSPSAEH